MRLVVTDSGYIWNHENPALKPYKDIVLVVCLSGKKVTDEYECFICPSTGIFLGEDGYGLESRVFDAINDVADKLNRAFFYRDNIVFLTDWNPESLYPYFVTKNKKDHNSFHLCVMSPYKPNSNMIDNEYQRLVSDLSNIDSFFYTSREDLLYGNEQLDTPRNVNKRAYDYYSGLLPTITDGIKQMNSGQHYFDFHTMNYVYASEGFYDINSNPSSVKKSGNIKSIIPSTTLGICLPHDYPEDYSDTKTEIERSFVRPDGKDICDLLRKYRIMLAESNCIPFSSEDCPSNGPCAGTCTKCDDEANYLREKMEEIAEDKRIYPHFNVNEVK